MTSRAGRRDPDRERKERLTFIVLQHVESLGSETSTQPIPPRIADELAMDCFELEELLEALAAAELIVWTGGRDAVRIAPAGTEYVRTGARRRRSVRLFTPRPRPPE